MAQKKGGRSFGFSHCQKNFNTFFSLKKGLNALLSSNK